MTNAETDLSAEGITEIHADGRITHTMGSRYALAGRTYTAPITLGTKVTIRTMGDESNDWKDRTRTGLISGAEWTNGGYERSWWYEVTLADGTVDHSNQPKVVKPRGERKAGTPRAKVEKPTGPLPKIIAYIGISDSGEYGNATCPHCGALGRYVHEFIVEGGQRRGAMAGCVKLFPISPVAEEHARIIDRAKDRDKRGQALASWDLAKLEAIEAFIAGSATEADTLNVIRRENDKRLAWMARRNGGRR